MCRLLAYKGPPVILDDLLYKPEHSLIKQSFHATEMDEPLNGDGFGVGWYAHDLDPNPAVFTSVRPAWNNQNLQYITPKIGSDCVFAHVRSASVGIVNELNCHPFHCRNFLMMHNGGIHHFRQIKRPLLAKLSDPNFHTIKGQTDSEHIFALFLEHLPDTSCEQDLSDMLDALKNTVDDLLQLKTAYGLEEASELNLLITDGTRIVGSRYITNPDKKPLSLHYTKGGQFECKNGMYTLQEHQEGERAVLFVSEKLNEHAQAWQSVPENHFFTVDKNGAIEFIPV